METKDIEKKVNGKEMWITNYSGHEIKVVNKARTAMYIDGVEVAKQKGLLASQIFLQANIPDTDKTIIARVFQKNSGDSVLSCDFVVGEKLPADYGFQHKDGTIDILNEEELKKYLEMQKEEEDVVLITTLLN